MDTQATLKQPTRCRMCARRRRRRRRSATGAASARRSASSACESGRRKPWNAQRVCKRGTASKQRPSVVQTHRKMEAIDANKQGADEEEDQVEYYL